jgi:hypothetical protein
MSSRTMLPGVALCSPFAQGDLDNLCGLYAAVNALCVTSAPIRPFSTTEVKQVQQAGITHLQRRRWLSDALIHGMALRRQRAVTQHMAKAATSIANLNFAVTPLASGAAKLDAHATLQLLAGRIGAGSAVIACLENTFWHYTVISGVSASRVYLFDSDGLHWIERRSFGICDRGSQLRHCVSLASLIEVSVISA